MADTSNRRPLASRETSWATGIARRIAATRITPNQISIAGMVAALIAGLAFWAAGTFTDRWVFLILGALGCQVRLLCNLFDGMVAIEAGRAAPDGGFWNEMPDRISDMLILMGVALGLGEPALGWAAVSFAFLTAYVRELGVTCGAGADFAGPMAKQHRMALITLAALVSLTEPLWHDGGISLAVALWGVAVGAAATALRRSVRLVIKLRRGGAGLGGAASKTRDSSSPLQ
jgi:phosphatidylglycerophosphate synthase